MRKLSVACTDELKVPMSLLVFDMDGTPIRQFLLDRDISMFAVSKNDTLLIGYTTHTETGIPEFFAYDISQYH